MAKRGDNIHKRKDGRWEGRYQKGRRENGTLLYGSIYGKSYREVKKRLSDCYKEEKASKPKTHEKTFGEVLDLWMKSNGVRLKGGTIQKYQTLIDTHIYPELGHLELSKITTPFINDFLMYKLQSGRLDNAGGLSPSYVRSMMLVINAALKFAVNEQWCQPLKSHICKPTLLPKELTILSPNQQVQLEEYLKQELNPTKAGILISLYTGLRIGEICALAWEDIDFQTNIIHVRHTIARVKSEDVLRSTCFIIDTPKTHSSLRDIPISSVLLPILMVLEKKKSSKYVISETETFVNPRTYEYRYHTLLRASGIPSYNYHALRHTFATRCVAAGVDVKSLSEILGHANVSITLNTYVHSSIEMKRLQLEKICENGPNKWSACEKV